MFEFWLRWLDTNIVKGLATIAIGLAFIIVSFVVHSSSTEASEKPANEASEKPANSVILGDKEVVLTYNPWDYIPNVPSHLVCMNYDGKAIIDREQIFGMKINEHITIITSLIKVNEGQENVTVKRVWTFQLGNLTCVETEK